MTPLRQRFIEDLQLRNRSPRTIEVYVYHLREFASYFGQSPDQLGLDHAHRYILYLLNDKKASWSAYNQAVSALRFFYRVTCPVAGVVPRLPLSSRSCAWLLQSFLLLRPPLHLAGCPPYRLYRLAP